jgi:hypothetical protein
VDILNNTLFSCFFDRFLLPVGTLAVGFKGYRKHFFSKLVVSRSFPLRKVHQVTLGFDKRLLSDPLEMTFFPLLRLNQYK